MLVGIPPFYNDNITVLYQNIQKGKLKIPKYLSKPAKNILLKMLHKEPNKRPTIEQVKKDPFFSGINWELLGLKRYRPPIKLDKPPKSKIEEANKKELNEILVSQNKEGGPIFTDIDYSESNMNYNRVRNYSFVRKPTVRRKMTAAQAKK